MYDLGIDTAPNTLVKAIANQSRKSSKSFIALNSLKMEDLRPEDGYQTYKLGNFKLKSGGEIPNAFIAYKTLGDPSLPAIVYPTWYSGCKHNS